MRHTILSISKAKAHLLELARQVDEEGRAYVVTKDGTPLCALVPMEAYEALLETSDVLSDTSTLQQLEQALAQEKKGQLWSRNAKGEWSKVTRPKRSVPKRRAA